MWKHFIKLEIIVIAKHSWFIKFIKLTFREKKSI